MTAPSFSPSEQPEEPPCVAATLAWCNEMRAKYGRGEPLERLPKGKRKEPESCPCGKSTGLSVGPLSYGLIGKGSRLNLPELVSEFVREFDGGRLPQYDEDVP